MSYLDTPRLHFAGFFQADVSTVNNDVRHYDNARFKPEYQEFQPADQTGKGAWNPEGTGVFRLVGCRITGARLDGRLLTTRPEDTVIGMALENADARVAGKLVDLDPQQQLVSQIWGMRLRLAGSGETALFEGEYQPAPFINLWRRQHSGLATDQTLGTVFQSVLRSVVWKGAPGSRVLDALRQASAEGWLSISMNVYGYGRDPAIPRYTLGRVTGTIGPHRVGEPKHFVMGRQMAAEMASVDNPTVPKGGVYFFQCKLHPERRLLSADFGNCLKIADADGRLEDCGALTMAVLRTDTDEVLSTVEAEQVVLLGDVPYRQPDWYAQTAGVEDFDFAADSWLCENIADHPLLLLGPQTSGGYKVLVQESLGGLYVRADSFVCRLNPGQSASVDLFASRWGRPLGATIQLSATEGAMGGSGAGNQPLDPPVPIPAIATPAGAIGYPAQVESDASGKAVLKIEATPAGPGNPRGYIDGQLYGIACQLAQQPAHTVGNFWNYVSVLVFDRTPVPDQPTWHADIQPILQQYGNLYPIMSKHLVDLGDYDSVVRNRGILKLAFSLPIDDPNHMPVTRDLSDAKRAMILKWLASAGADGLPVKGQPPSGKAAAVAPKAEVSPVSVQLQPLQTAGKTAVLLEHEARKQVRSTKS
jgi:hypothetical protein